MYNDQLVYKVVIWAFFGISLWKEKVALNKENKGATIYYCMCDKNHPFLLDPTQLHPNFSWPLPLNHY